jgi:hypothetical protein
MTDNGTLSGAQLKVVLDGLGLPPSWFADRLNVTMRTVVRWFDGDPIPAKVGAELERLEATTVKEMHKVAKTASRKGVLHTYRVDSEFDSDMPATWHRALSFRVLEHLKANGEDVKVQYR